MGKKISYIDEVDIANKQIIMRVDYNVSLNPDHSLADDARVRQSMPTILYLLSKGCRLILVSHLGRPKNRDLQFSLSPVITRLQQYLPHYFVKLIADFQSENLTTFTNQKQNEILMLENIRFYPQEKANDEKFAKQLAHLAEVYVNDAFGVSHRTDASVVSIARFLPAYGGLLLKKEIETIGKIINQPQKPVVVILGGGKISTKINLIDKLMTLADYMLIGGAMANTFYGAQNISIGKSKCEPEQFENAQKLLRLAQKRNTQLLLPPDVIVAASTIDNESTVVNSRNVPLDTVIVDIGPETQALFGRIIAQAKTIIWNGPIGCYENPAFRRGTDFIYYSITKNSQAVSLVGGGDTLAAVSKKEYLDKITHLSTGGGAMLEFIEKGTLPGIEVLKK